MAIVSAQTKHIGILFFENVEELDAVGPYEVLSSWTRNFPEDGWGVVTIAKGDDLIRCAKGLTVKADYTYDEMPALEVLVYPGGHGTRAHLEDEQQLEWVRRQRKQVSLMTSVCTGALVYAAAGLLLNRSATTHWASLEKLRQLDPTIDVREDVRFVDDGDLITSAGVSAGVDMALHLVHRLGGIERARQVRRGIQYDPEPPV
jgi:transcriptional regulator GlxA family with amidase domain